MKYFIAIAMIVAVASAKAIVQPADLAGLSPSALAEVQQILEAIHSPSTDPTTAAMLEQMLSDLLGLTVAKPPITLPAIIDESEPIHVGPAIIDDFEPIHVSPEIVDFPIVDSVEAPVVAAQVPSGSPLVQIIVNVAGGSSPVTVEQPEVVPTPVHVVDQVEDSEFYPTPVEIVEEENKPEPVIIGELPEVVAMPEPVLVGELPEAVVVAPIIVAPAVVGPENLN